MLGSDVECDTQVWRHPDDDRNLHAKLKSGPGYKPPRQINGETRQFLLTAEEYERDDLRDVHHHAGRVGQQEFVMAVEHAKAPGAEDEKSGSWKDDADQLDC